MAHLKGFPFDDEGGFGRRADIRSHLDDLAARHPEFADHLLGPPWADVPFGGGGSLHRNRNRRASTDRSANNYHHPDEDARSQTSAGSGVSSHGSEADSSTEPKHQPPKSTGLRTNHTLDIGQHQHNMENPQQQQQQRNVRSMSAPPENRNNQNEQPGQPRFVSRVDITPQGQPQTTSQTATQQSPQPQQTQREKSPGPQQPAPQPKPQAQSQQSHGNVRHIPIFVEGRDEPVLAKDADRRAPPPPPPMDEPDFPRRQQSPPHFHRPSHFSQQHFNKHPPSGWSSFQDPFFEHSAGQWPPRHPRDSPFGEFRRPQQPDKARAQQTQYQEPPQPKRQAPAQQQTQSEAQQEAPPKPRQQVQPKDPLERVALVQHEVDALTEQVRQYTGNSRQDKQYMYLDEMLTRELIKLDDIETEGKESVRQARKQAIKSIQESISLLESKAPLPGQQQESQSGNNVDQVAENKASEDKTAESMDTSEPPATEEQKAIPLPPPSSPIKAAAPEETQPQEEPAPKAEEKQAEQSCESSVEAPAAIVLPEPAAAAPVEADPQEPPKVEENKPSDEPMDSSAPAVAQPQQQEQQQQQQDVEMRQPSPAKEASPVPEPEKTSELAAVPAQDEKKDAKLKEAKQPEVKTESTTTTAEKPKKEPPPVPAKPGKSPKKAKKAPKKQPEPVSETAIPMPAPGQ